MEFLIKKHLNNTSLMNAAEKGYLEIVQELLSHKEIDINCKNI